MSIKSSNGGILGICYLDKGVVCIWHCKRRAGGRAVRGGALRGRVHGRGHGPSGGYASAVPRRPVPAADPARVRARGAGQRADVPLFCTQLALCGQGGLHVRHLYFLGQHLLYRHQYPIRFHGVGAQRRRRRARVAFHVPQRGRHAGEPDHRRGDAVVFVPHRGGRHADRYPGALHGDRRCLRRVRRGLLSALLCAVP